MRREGFNYPFQSILVAFLFTLIYPFPALSEQEQTPAIMGVLPPAHNLFCFNAAPRPFRGTLTLDDAQEAPLRIRARRLRRVARNQTDQTIVYSIAGARVHRLSCGAISQDRRRAVRRIRRQARQCPDNMRSCRRAARIVFNQANRFGFAPIPLLSDDDDTGQPDTQPGFNCDKADLNGDGRVNAQDLAILLSYWGSGFEPADLSLNGVVDSEDQSILMGCWGHTYDPNAGPVPAACEDPNYNPFNNLHDFTGLPVTCDGWTDFNALIAHPEYYNDSRVVYVSSSQGNDSTGQAYDINSSTIGNDPFLPSGSIQPFRTLEGAYSQLRDGYPDVMLLKRGDVWMNMEWGIPDTRRISGRSAKEPMLFSSYGDSSMPRPIIIGKRGVRIHGFGRSSIVVTGLHMIGSETEWGAPGVGIDIRLADDGGDFLFEDVLVERFNIGMGMMSIDGTASNITVRRSAVVDNHWHEGHSQGLYAEAADNLLIEECLFDRNGWQNEDRSDATPFNHNFYINRRSSNVTLRNNIISRASSHGLKLETNGIVYNNLIVRNAIGVFMRAAPGEARSNVILEGVDISADLHRGFGFWVGPVDHRNPNSGPAVLEDNLVLNRISLGSGQAFLVERNPAVGEAISVTIRDNGVKNWRDHDPITFVDPVDQYGDVLVENNSWQTGEQLNAEGVNLGTYHGSLGREASFDAFMEEARKQSRSNWRQKYTAEAVNKWIRAQ